VVQQLSSGNFLGICLENLEKKGLGYQGLLLLLCVCVFLLA